MPKIYCWGYRDGKLLPDGFVEAIDSRKGPGDEPEAELRAVIRLAESCGIEVCIGDAEEHNEDVGQWIEEG